MIWFTMINYCYSINAVLLGPQPRASEGPIGGKSFHGFPCFPIAPRGKPYHGFHTTENHAVVPCGFASRGPEPGRLAPRRPGASERTLPPRRPPTLCCGGDGRRSPVVLVNNLDPERATPDALFNLFRCQLNPRRRKERRKKSLPVCDGGWVGDGLVKLSRLTSARRAARHHMVPWAAPPRWRCGAAEEGGPCFFV